MHLFWTFSLDRFATVIVIVMLIKVSYDFLCNENTMNLCSKFPNLTTLKNLWVLHSVSWKKVITNKTESNIWHLYNCWIPGFICLQDHELYSCCKVFKRKIWRTLNVVEDFVEEMLLTISRNANLKKIVTLLLAVNDVSKNSLIMILMYSELRHIKNSFCLE